MKWKNEAKEWKNGNENEIYERHVLHIIIKKRERSRERKRERGGKKLREK